MWCVVQRKFVVLQWQCQLNNMVCITAIDCCANVAQSAEKCGVQYSDILLCYSGTVC